MRIVTAIVSIIMAAVLYDFSETASFASRFANSDELSGIAGAALIGAFLWVVGGAIVYFYPRIAIAIFLLSFAVIGLAQLGASVETDLLIYMWFGPIFALTSFVGWKEKRRADSDKQSAQDQVVMQQSQMNYLLSQQRSATQSAALRNRAAQYQADTGVAARPTKTTPKAKYCSNCGAAISTVGKFCSDCGSRL